MRVGRGRWGDETGLGVQIKLLEGREQKERDWRRRGAGEGGGGG